MFFKFLCHCQTRNQKQWLYKILQLSCPSRSALGTTQIKNDDESQTTVLVTRTRVNFRWIKGNGKTVNTLISTGNLPYLCIVLNITVFLLANNNGILQNKT